MIAILAILLTEVGSKDLPTYIILPLSFLVPIGVLVVGALIKPRGGGH